MADPGEKPVKTPSHFPFWGKKDEITEGGKASRASKAKLPRQAHLKINSNNVLVVVIAFSIGNMNKTRRKANSIHQDVLFIQDEDLAFLSTALTNKLICTGKYYSLACFIDSNG